MSDLQILIEAVLKQIQQDIAKGDVTAIEELLMCVPMDNLKAYLPPDEPFDFTWNYRIVNAKSENGGEDWYCLKEVTYSKGKPTGYGNPCTGSETVESMRNVWQMMEKAMQLPPLQEEDFEKGEDYTFEDLFNASQEPMEFVEPKSLEIAKAMNRLILERKLK
jgi:hypothetical protein